MTLVELRGTGGVSAVESGVGVGLEPARFSDRDLRPIGEKVLRGEWLDLADGMALWNTRDIFSLGEMANFVRRQKHGNLAYYNINRHINRINNIMHHKTKMMRMRLKKTFDVQTIPGRQVINSNNAISSSK